MPVDVDGDLNRRVSHHLGAERLRQLRGKVPTPPEAPSTNTFWPWRSRPLSRIACSAVLCRRSGRRLLEGVGNACILGEGAEPAGSEDLVAWLECLDTLPHGLNAAGDIESKDVRLGFDRPMPRRITDGLPRSSTRSAALIEAACTRSRTSSSRGVGFSTSSTLSVGRPVAAGDNCLQTFRFVNSSYIPT